MESLRALGSLYFMLLPTKPLRDVDRGEPFEVGPSPAAGTWKSVNGREWQAGSRSLRQLQGQSGARPQSFLGHTWGRLRLGVIRR